MIKGKCIVLSDPSCKVKWPQVFACVPVPGDKVLSEDGKITAIVANINHAQTAFNKLLEPKCFPFIIVELHVVVGIKDIS